MLNVKETNLEQGLKARVNVSAQLTNTSLEFEGKEGTFVCQGENKGEKVVPKKSSSKKSSSKKRVPK